MCLPSVFTELANEIGLVPELLPFLSGEIIADPRARVLCWPVLEHLLGFANGVKDESQQLQMYDDEA